MFESWRWNHTKIANSENNQKSNMPSLISPWLGGEKVKISETSSLLDLILNKEGSILI